MSRRLRPLPALTLAALLALGGFTAAPPPGEAAPAVASEANLLEVGVLRRVRLARGALRWDGAFEVPAGVEAIQVVLQSRQDVDLYVGKGDLPPESLDAVTARDTSEDGEEHVAMEGPPAGRYWVTVKHPAAERGGTTFQLAVLFTGGSEPAFVAMGETAGVRVTAEGLLRAWTCVPLDADELTWSAPGAQAVLTDPAGPRTRGQGQGFPVRAPGPHLLEVRGGALEAGGTEALTLGPKGASAPSGPALLVPGVETELRLGGAGNPATREFRIVVPQGVPGLELSVVSSPGSDVDVYARRDETAAADDDVDDVYTLTTGTEDLLVLGGTKGVAPGTWSIKVHSTDDEDSADVTVLLLAAGRAVAPGTRGGKAPPSLAPDAWVRGRLVPEEEGTAWFAVDVPRQARRLHVQLVGATSDLELFVADRAWGIVRARAITQRLDEGLVMDLDPDAEGDDRHVVVGVMNPQSDEDEVSFRLGVAFDRPVRLPDDLRLPPFAPAPGARPLERAAAAVVDIATEEGGGSGVCLTAGGLIVTCRHVLEVDDDGDEMIQDGILIAFIEQVDRAPRQTHVARLVDSDRDLDLALLEITGDIYGRPLPPDVAFDHLTPDPKASVALGEDLWVLGYPSIGSERSRTPVIAVRGVVCGQESSSTGPGWIKTDAHISDGHSGGAALDPRLHLVGFACATLGKFDQLGLIRPVSNLPSAWWARIRRTKPVPPK